MTVTLNESDLQQVVNISSELSFGCELSTLYRRTLRLLEPALGSTSSVYFPIRNPEKDSLQFEVGSSRGVPSSAPRQWSREYWDKDPFMAAMLDNVARRKSPVTVSSDLIRHRDYVNSEFYNQFLKPQSVYHIMVVGLLQNGVPIGAFGFHRPHDAQPFSRCEVAKASVLAPALATAVARARAEEALRVRDWIIETVAKDIPHKGVLILDEALKVHFVNDGARELLGLSDSEYQVLPPGVRRLCKRLLREHDQPKGGSEAEIQAQVHTLHLDSGEVRHAVYFGQGDRRVVSDETMRRYGLSARESEVVRLVARGHTNPEVADRMCISPRTVQNHLRSVYSKVGVHNRTSLLYHLAGAGFAEHV